MIRNHLSAFTRRSACVVVLAVFAAALLVGAAAASAARAEAKRPAQAAKRKRAERAKQRPKAQRVTKRAAETKKSRESLYAPTDGKEEEGDKVNGREEWFRMRRGMGAAAGKADARRRAWASRPKGRLKGDPSRGIMTAGVPEWKPLGPTPTTPTIAHAWGTVSGRINAIAVKPDDENVVLIGASTGGIWRSADAGSTFVPVSDSQVDLSVGSIAFAPSNPSVVYAGMGDYANSYFGTGVLKSTDGGATWARVSRLHDTDCAELPAQGQPGCLPASGIARKILVHPADPNRVFLAQTSQLAESGMIAGGFSYSTDGGVNWATTFRGQVRDLAIHPTNPQLLYLTNLTSNYPGELRPGLYRSTDGGLTWQLSFNEFYFGQDSSNKAQDVRVAVSPATPNRVYLLTGTWGSWVRYYYNTKSGDPSSGWVNWGERDIDPGSFGYNSYIVAHPTVADTIYVGVHDVFKTTNGGSTFTNLTTNFHKTCCGEPWWYGPGAYPNKAHPDQHALAFSPTDPQTFYIGNDGGLWKTTDGGVNFTSLNRTLSLSQFIGIAAHPTDGGFLVGGTQDNGTQLRDRAGLGWTEFAGGDGGHPVINPVDPRAVLSTYVRETIRRWQINPDGTKVEKPGGTNQSTFWNYDTERLARIAFYPPFKGNGVDQTVYFGAERLFVSRDFADTVNVDAPTWTAPGGNIDQTFVSDGRYSDTLSAIGVQRTAYSPTQVIYTGSMLGRVMASRDGGATWADAMGGLPRGYVESITVAPSDPTGATAFLTLGAYGNLMASGAYDYFGNGHVFKTTDFGATWNDIGGTDPATKLPDIPVSTLLIDPSNPNIIYAGTDIGVFRSTADGMAWETFNNGMPPALVVDFAVSANGKILAATYGRGIYELTTNAVAPSPVTLAPVADAYVKGATPDANFGTAAELQVKRAYTAGSGKGRQAYLRFDTSSVSGSIKKATLRVYGRLSAAAGANVNIPLAAFPVSTAWGESALTWNNKPAPDVPAELARVTVVDATARWYEFDVTSFVNSERAAGRSVTGVLLRNMLRGEIGDYYTAVNSKEAAANQPQLVIEQ